MVSTARPVALMYQSVSMPGGPAPQRPTILRHDTSPAALRATIEPKFLRLSSYNIAEVYGLARMLEAQAQKQAEANARERRREEFLVHVLKSMSHFGASLNSLEERMLHAARDLDLQLKVVRQPHTITCYLGDPSTRRRMLTIRSPTKTELSFGIDQVQRIYTAVVKKQLAMGPASTRLQQIRTLPPTKVPTFHIIMSTVFAAALAATLSGAGAVDVFVAFMVTLSLCFLHRGVTMKARFWGDLLETVATIVLSACVHDGGFFANGFIAVIPGFMYFCASAKRTHTFMKAEVTVAAFAFAYAYALSCGLPVILDFVLIVKTLTLGFYLRALVVPHSSTPRSLNTRSMPGSKIPVA